MEFKVFNLGGPYGMTEALIGAGYPMQTEVGEMPDDLTVDEYIKLIRRGKRLGNSPHGHGDDKFLRQIIVGFDVQAPRYWWQEFDTYTFTVKNSQSTMHRGTKMQLKKRMGENTTKEAVDLLYKLANEYNNDQTEENFLKYKANLPEGFMITARVVTSYAQLKTIYYQRKHHRLPEWRAFCHWIETLPNAIAFGVCGKKQDEKSEA